MMTFPMLLAMLAAAPQAGTAPAAPMSDAAAEPAIRSVMGERVAGKPVPCVQTRMLGNSMVLPGVGIVYKATGSRYYLNRPRAGMELLSPDTLIISRSNGSRLCDSDQIEIQNRFDQTFIGNLQLGQFVPYQLPRR